MLSPRRRGGVHRWPPGWTDPVSAPPPRPFLQIARLPQRVAHAEGRLADAEPASLHRRITELEGTVAALRRERAEQHATETRLEDDLAAAAAQTETLQRANAALRAQAVELQALALEANDAHGSLRSMAQGYEVRRRLPLARGRRGLTGRGVFLLIFLIWCMALATRRADGEHGPA